MGEGAVTVTVSAEDSAGNLSAGVPLTVELDCTPPRVEAAAWDGDRQITVSWSEHMDPASLMAAMGGGGGGPSRRTLAKKRAQSKGKRKQARKARRKNRRR